MKLCQPIRTTEFEQEAKTSTSGCQHNQTEMSLLLFPCLPQPESLCKVTGYTLEHIKPCLMDLHRTYLKAAQHTQQSIREKYKSTK